MAFVFLRSYCLEVHTSRVLRAEYYRAAANGGDFSFWSQDHTCFAAEVEFSELAVWSSS